MYFMPKYRYNPESGREEDYLTLKESFRDKAGRVRTRTLLTVGFVQGLKPEEVAEVARCLTWRNDHRGQAPMFEDGGIRYSSEAVREHTERYWSELQKTGAIDGLDEARRKADAECRGLLRTRTVKHTDARNAGAEWLCLQAINQLRIRELLLSKGWRGEKADTAIAHLVARTVYGASELRTRSIMAENSAVCELVSGNRDWLPSLRSLYESTDSLYEIKRELEGHLCAVTDDLFNQRNRIVLFDLTNFYFEGTKRNSKRAKFGRSKEKRSDCKLLVLALCVNTDGFIRHSELLEGNTADPKSLPSMVDGLVKGRPGQSEERQLVVIDAGIATEDNLQLLKERGYDYLCVSRARLRDYELSEDRRSVTVLDSRRQKITLREVHTPEDGDWYLEVTSPSKAMTEASMNRQWRERFELELEKASEALGRKGGTKNYEKVVERVGRARGKYPSVAKYYNIEYERDARKPENMGSIRWTIRNLSEMESGHGVYFLRTNIRTLDEKTTWDYYNLIREIECTNRQLKTDLNLRPIYHRTDSRADAHLFFGLLAYWVVNSIRVQLKRQGEKCYWTEIVRRMSTQKLVTTEAHNALGERVELRQCSEPTRSAAAIYDKLLYRHYPFRKIKICTTQT